LVIAEVTIIVANLCWMVRCDHAHTVLEYTTCYFHSWSSQKPSARPTQSTVSARQSSTPFGDRSERHVTRPTANQRRPI